MWVTSCTKSLIFQDRRFDYVVIYDYDFDRPYPPVLVLYGYVIIFRECYDYPMMWCEMILSYDVDLRDVGVWNIVVDIFLFSFRFTGGRHYLRFKML
jgi:hypothetical protein